MTDPSDGKQLQYAWRALAEEASGDTPVDDESVWRAAAAESPEGERLAVIDAVARDPAAAESWRLAQELQRQLERREPSLRSASPPAVRTPTEPPPPWRRAWVAMAAMIVLGLGLGFWRFVVPSPSPGDEEIFRDSGAPELRSLVPEDVAQPRDGVILRWSDLGAGTRYTVRVVRPSSEALVVKRDLTGSSLRLPAERLAAVAEGERLLWQVEARLADGRIVKSKTFFLDLVPAMEGSTPSDIPQPQEP